jgi:hypothetical protein
MSKLLKCDHCQMIATLDDRDSDDYAANWLALDWLNDTDPVPLHTRHFCSLPCLGKYVADVTDGKYASDVELGHPGLPEVEP